MTQAHRMSAVSMKLLACTFLLWFSVYTYPSFLSVYAQTQLGASPVFVGTIVGSYGLVQLILRIPLGVGSDLLKRRKPFMLAGFLASALSAVGFAFTKDAWLAVAFRALAGVAASTWVILSVMYSAQFSGASLSSAMGILTVVQYGAQLLAMLLGGRVALWFGERAAFLMALAAGALGLIVMARVPDAPSDAPPQRFSDLLLVAKNKRLLSATCLSILMQFISWGTILGFTANWATARMGLDAGQLGVLSAINLLPSVILPRYSGGVWSEKFGQRRVVTVGFALIAVACVLIGFTGTPLLLYAVQLVYGSGTALIAPLMIANAISDIPVQRRGAAMGFYQSLYSVGMFLGPMLSGGVIEWVSGGAGGLRGYEVNFLLMAALALIGVVLTRLLIPSGQSKE